MTLFIEVSQVHHPLAKDIPPHLMSLCSEAVPSSPRLQALLGISSPRPILERFQIKFPSHSSKLQ